MIGAIAAHYVAALLAVADTFTRADSTSSLGTTTTGAAAWSALRGTWGISTNRAYLSNGNASQVNLAAVDSGVTDCTIQFTIAAIATGEQPGAFFRATDQNNGYILEGGTASATTKLYKWVAGAATQIGATAGNAGFSAGDVVQIVLAGSSITINRNGATIISVTDSTFLTQTMHGFYVVAPNGASPAVRLDDFSVTA